jgi:hypothetical protein
MECPIGMKAFDKCDQRADASACVQNAFIITSLLSTSLYGRSVWRAKAGGVVRPNHSSAIDEDSQDDESVHNNPTNTGQIDIFVSFSYSVPEPQFGRGEVRAQV